MKIKIISVVIFCFGLIIGVTQSGYAQDDSYTVHVRRDFGYGMGSDIQGTFSIRLLGEEEDVSSVTFYVDGSVLGNVTEKPFSIQFKTEQFEPGLHRLYAEVLLDNGNIIRTDAVQYNFLSQKESTQQIRDVLIWVGGAILGTMVIVSLVQSILINKGGKSAHQPGTPRNYGVLGGTICRKCGRPFPRHIWGMNLVIGRLDRCDNCGKWVMTTRATPKALRLAEEAEMDPLEEDQTPMEIEENEEDRLEETKYFDEV